MCRRIRNILLIFIDMIHLSTPSPYNNTRYRGRGVSFSAKARRAKKPLWALPFVRVIALGKLDAKTHFSLGVFQLSPITYLYYHYSFGTASS